MWKKKGEKYSHAVGLEHWRKVVHKQLYDLETETLTMESITLAMPSITLAWEQQSWGVVLEMRGKG